jgi:AcrR family transcriptional regulator/NAD(P)-dependent dehydrogenase (short-subunit alcohol dehydrogenase family)
MPEIPTTIKKKELVEKKREQIILAAIKLFCKKGFHKTTLKDISEEAGISQGSIYDYIRTKEDIFFLVHDYMATLLEGEVLRSVENIEDPFEKLKEIICTELNLIYDWSDPILLMYQEAHSLSKPLMKVLLEREKKHVTVFENVLKDCIKKGILRDFNSRITANLLVSLIHTFVLRRWDLTKYITAKETERAVLELFFHGLLKQKGLESEHRKENRPLEGKSILIVNGSTRIGRSLSSFLLSKGASLAIHADGLSNETELLSFLQISSENIKFYSTKDYGELTLHLFDQILNDLGQINIVIQDLSVAETKTTFPSNLSQTSQRLESNFKCAEDLPILLEKSMNKSGSSRLLYIAPWAWDKYTSPLSYEVLKAGTVALTKAMAKRLAPSRINVNCIVPGFISGVKLPDMEREKTSEIFDLVPLKRMGELQDVIDAVYYFISDSAKYVTGQVLEVTGGIS